MAHDPTSIARASYEAYAKKDRAALEAIIGDDFHFSSPLDNRLDRTAYFERCWPNSKRIERFEFIHLVAHGDRVFVTYEGQSKGGHRFRNTEILTVRNGKIVDAEVYFGWSIPHPAPQGGFVEEGRDDLDDTLLQRCADQHRVQLGAPAAADRTFAAITYRCRRGVRNLAARTGAQREQHDR